MDYEGSNFLEVFPYTHINGKTQAHYKSSHWSMRTYAYEAQKNYTYEDITLKCSMTSLFSIIL